MRNSIKTRRQLRDFFTLAKDGVITGSADNDPAGIATYSQVGATVGFSQLWLMLLTLPMLTAVEEMSARVGVVTKRGLNAVIAQTYGLPMALMIGGIVLVANTATIGADLAGMAAAVELLTGIPYLTVVLPIAVVLGYILVRENYRAMSRLLFLLTPFFLLYVISGLLARPEWSEVVTKTFIPTVALDGRWLALAVALLGTTLSPYLIFWQTTEEVEEKKTVKQAKGEARGVFAGMLYSHFIFYFVIVAAGAVLFNKSGEIQTAADAAAALRPLAGPLAGILFSVGILFSGLLAIPILAASTAYTVADALHWQEGLDKKLTQARGFYGVMLGGLAIGMGLSFFGLEPIEMLVWSQVLNGFLMPILLLVLLLITSRKDLMGEHKNGWFPLAFGSLSIIVFVVLDLLLLLEWLR